MKLDFSNYEIVKADGMDVFYNMPQFESPTQEEADLVQRLSCCFNPVPGAFTVGHTLIAFDEPNLNKDTIPESSSSFYARCMVGQACTWQHDGGIIIGGVMDCFTQFSPSSKPVLGVMTRFWEGRAEVADYVDQVIAKYNQKALKFSFENLTGMVACSQCGNEYPAVVDGGYDHYCEHLKMRHQPGSTVSRILTDFVPIGEGVVDFPAYVGSKSLIAASNDQLKRVAELVDKINIKFGKIIKF